MILARHIPRLLLAAATLVAAGLSADAQPDILLSRPMLDYRMDSTEQFATVLATRSGEGVVVWNTRYRSAEGLMNRLAVSSLSEDATSWLSSPEDRPYDTVIVHRGHDGYIALWPDSAGGTRSLRGRLIDGAGTPIAESFTLGPYLSTGFAGAFPAPDLPGFVVVWSVDVDSTPVSYLRLIDEEGRPGPLSEYAGRVTSVDWVTSYLGDNRLVRVTSKLHLKIAPDGSVEPIRSIRDIPPGAYYGPDGEVLYFERGRLYSLANLTDSIHKSQWSIPHRLTPLPVVGRYKGAAFVVADSTWQSIIEPPTQYHTSGYRHHTLLAMYFPEGFPDDTSQWGLYSNSFVFPPSNGSIGEQGPSGRAFWEFSSDVMCDQHHEISIKETYIPYSGAPYDRYEIYKYDFWLSSGRRSSLPECSRFGGSVSYISDSATAAVEVSYWDETWHPDGVPIAPLIYPQPGNSAGVTLIGDDVVAVWHDVTHDVNRVHYLDDTLREQYYDSTRQGDGLRQSASAATFLLKLARVRWEVDTLRFVIPTILGLRHIEFEFDWTTERFGSVTEITRTVRNSWHEESDRLLILLGGSITEPLTAVMVDSKYGTYYLQGLPDRTVENTWLLGWRDSVLHVGDSSEILEIDPSGTATRIGGVPAPHHEIAYWAELDSVRSVRLQRLPDSLWRLEHINYTNATEYAFIDLDMIEPPLVRKVGDDGTLALIWGSDSGVRLSLLDRRLRPLEDSLDPAEGGIRVSASSAPAELPFAVIDEEDLVVTWNTADSGSQVYIRKVALPLPRRTPETPPPPIEEDTDTTEGDSPAPRYELSVRPNPPARGGPISLEIDVVGSLQEDRPITIEVLNALGQRVRSMRLENVPGLAEPILLLTTGWPSGRYLLRVSDGETSEEISVLYFSE